MTSSGQQFSNLYKTDFLHLLLLVVKEEFVPEDGGSPILRNARDFSPDTTSYSKGRRSSTPLSFQPILGRSSTFCFWSEYKRQNILNFRMWGGTLPPQNSTLDTTFTCPILRTVFQRTFMISPKS